MTGHGSTTSLAAMALDLDAVRADTPATATIAHFNNCGSSLPPEPVVTACVDYLRLEAEIGGYEAAADRADDLDRFYGAGAELLNCSPTEIAFTSSAAQAWWRSFEVIPLAAGDRVLVSSTEYQSNAFALLQAREQGVDVELIPNCPTGEVDLDQLAAMLDERVRVVAITHIGLGNGMIQPAEEIGALVAPTDALYLLDSCQAAGQLPLDVEALQCDFLSFTGRKFMRGPRGTGLLYERASIVDQLDPPRHIDGRSAVWTSPFEWHPHPGAIRHEFGEYSYAAKLGLGVAIDYALNIGLDEIADRNTSLALRLRTGLDAIDGVTVHDQGQRQSAIVTFNIRGIEACDVVPNLREQRLHLSAPDASASQFDLGERSIGSVVRAGVHYFQTDDEVDRLLTAVDQLARR